MLTVVLHVKCKQEGIVSMQSTERPLPYRRKCLHVAKFVGMILMTNPKIASMCGSLGLYADMYM